MVENEEAVHVLTGTDFDPVGTCRMSHGVGGVVDPEPPNPEFSMYESRFRDETRIDAVPLARSEGGRYALRCLDSRSGSRAW